MLQVSRVLQRKKLMRLTEKLRKYQQLLKSCLPEMISTTCMYLGQKKIINGIQDLSENKVNQKRIYYNEPLILIDRNKKTEPNENQKQDNEKLLEIIKILE